MADRYTELVFLPHTNEEPEAFARRIGVPDEFISQAIADLTSQGRLSELVEDSAPEDSILGRWLYETNTARQTVGDTDARYRGRSPVRAMEAFKSITPESYTKIVGEGEGREKVFDVDAFAHATNIRKEVAQSILDGDVEDDVWTDPDYLMANRADPKRRSLADIYVEAYGGRDTWQKKFIKNASPDTHWLDTGMNPDLAGEFVTLRRMEEARRLDPEERDWRISEAKKRIEDSVQDIVIDRAPNFRDRYIPEAEFDEYVNEFEAAQDYTGRALTTFRELDARSALPGVLKQTRLAGKRDPYSVSKAIEAAKFLGESQARESGKPLVMVLKPKARDGRTASAFTGETGKGHQSQFHFEDFEISYITPEEAEKAAGEKRLLMGDVAKNRFRFDSFGGMMEAIPTRDDRGRLENERLKYNREFGDVIEGIPIYLTTPERKNSLYLNAIDKHPKLSADMIPDPDLLASLQGFEEFGGTWLMRGASLLGTTSRFFAGITEKIANENPTLYEVLEGGLSNAAQFDPEKQVFYGKMFKDADFIHDIGFFEEEDPLLVDAVERERANPTDTTGKNLREKVEAEELYRLEKSAANFAEYKRVVRMMDEAPNAAAYHQAKQDYDFMREKHFSNLGLAAAGLAFDVLVDVLPFYRGATAKSARTAAQQVDTLVYNAERRLGKEAGKRLRKAVNGVRTRSGLEAVEEAGVVAKGAEGAIPPSTLFERVTGTGESMAAARKSGKEAGDEFAAALSPKKEAEDLVATRRGVFDKREPGAMTDLEPQLSGESRMARDLATEPGQVRKARSIIEDKVRQFGKESGLADDVVEAEINRTLDLLERAEKRGKFGLEGSSFKMPIIAHRLRPKGLQGITREFIQDKLPGIHKALDFIGSKADKIRLKNIFDKMALGTTSEKKKIVTAFEQVKNEYMEAYVSNSLGKYLEMTAEVTDDVKDLALFGILRDTPWKDEFLKSPLGKRLQKAYDKASLETRGTAETLRIKIEAMEGFNPKDIGGKYMDIADATGGQLDALVPTRLMEVGQAKTKYRIQEDLRLEAEFNQRLKDAQSPAERGAILEERNAMIEHGSYYPFSQRLSGARNPQEALDAAFQTPELKGRGFHFDEVISKENLGTEASDLATRISQTYDDYRVVGDMESSRGIAILDDALEALFKSKTKPRGISSDDILEGLRPSRGPVTLKSGEKEASTGFAELDLERQFDRATAPIKFQNEAQYQLVDDILNMNPKEYDTLRRWYTQTKPGAGKGPGSKMFANTADDIPVIKKRYLDSSVSYQADRLFPLLSGKEIPKGLWGAFQDFTNTWKGIATVWNPGFHVRNMTSGAFLYWLDGGDLTKLIPDYVDATKVLGVNLSSKASKAKWDKTAVKIKGVGEEAGEELSYAEVRALADKYNVTDSSFVLDDIPSDFEKIAENAAILATGRQPAVFGDLVGGVKGAAADLAAGKPLSAGKQLLKGVVPPELAKGGRNLKGAAIDAATGHPFKATAKLAKGVASPLAVGTAGGRKLGSFVEGQGRTALFINNLRNGMSPAEAAANVKRMFFDYGALPKSVKGAKPFIPFITWSSKNLSLQMETLLRDPGKYANLLKVGRAFTEQAKEEYGDDWERYVPDWLRGAATLAVPRVLNPTDDPFLLKFEAPPTSLIDAAMFVDKLEAAARSGDTDVGAGANIAGELKDTILGMTNPLIGVFAVVSGVTDSVYDPFRGRNLRRTKMREAEGRAKKFFDWVNEKRPGWMKNIQEMFDITKEKTEEMERDGKGGYKWTYPETSAYIINTLPPVMNIIKYLDANDAWDTREEKESMKKLWKGIGSIASPKPIPVDQVQAVMSDIWELQKEFDEFQVKDEAYWKARGTEATRKGKPMKKKTFMPKREKRKK